MTMTVPMFFASSMTMSMPVSAISMAVSMPTVTVTVPMPTISMTVAVFMSFASSMTSRHITSFKTVMLCVYVLVVGWGMIDCVDGRGRGEQAKLSYVLVITDCCAEWSTNHHTGFFSLRTILDLQGKAYRISIQRKRKKGFRNKYRPDEDRRSVSLSHTVTGIFWANLHASLTRGQQVDPKSHYEV